MVQCVKFLHACMVGRNPGGSEVVWGEVRSLVVERLPSMRQALGLTSALQEHIPFPVSSSFHQRRETIVKYKEIFLSLRRAGITEMMWCKIRCLSSTLWVFILQHSATTQNTVLVSGWSLKSKQGWTQALSCHFFLPLSLPLFFF